MHDFAAFRTHCGTLASGADLASAHSTEHLNFFWHHFHRNSFAEWIGVEEDGNGVFVNVIDGTAPGVDLGSYVTQGAGKHLVLPAGGVDGEFYRMGPTDGILGGVCEAPVRY